MINNKSQNKKVFLSLLNLFLTITFSFNKIIIDLFIYFPQILLFMKIMSYYFFQNNLDFNEIYLVFYCYTI